MEGKGMPLIGDKFPEMTVQTTHGKIELPKAFEGKWFILFSHPADFTPVCTTEFYAFQQRYPQFKTLNTELIGLSVDQVYSHIKWTEWITKTWTPRSSSPFIADHGKVADTLGLVHPGGGIHTVRAVFFVDPEGHRPRHPLLPGGTGPQLRRNLANDQRLPGGRRPGRRHSRQLAQQRLFGDDVIVPPASDESKPRWNVRARKAASTGGSATCPSK